MAEYITLDQLNAQPAQSGGYMTLGDVKKLSRAEIKAQIDNDEISQGARNPGATGSDALGGLSQFALNLLGGGVRGAGSIGATLARPFESAQENEQRRAGIDQNLASMGAQTDSWTYKGGKLGAEIAGTAGVGNVLARPVQALAASRYASGVEPILEGVARGLQTGGFRVGELAGTGAGTAARIGTGGLVGGASAGMVNQGDAGTGVMIGASLPGATQLAGAAGRYLRGSGSQITPEIAETARKSMDAGYLIPPSQVSPTFRNRAVESLSGKFETAQLASTQNQATTNKLVRDALGMAPDAPLSKEAMAAYRGIQHQAGYEPVRSFGMIPAGQKFNDSLDDIVKNFTGKGTIPALGKEKAQITELVNAHKSAGFDSGDAVDAIRVLRESADEAFGKGDKALGKTYKSLANAYEGAIDDALGAAGQKDLLTAYRNARQNIAKSFTVEKGLREGAGTVDARALGRELQKGKPLSGGLKTIAQFGNTFDKAAQPPHLIGSPGVNNLKPMGAAAMSAVGSATLGLPGLALGALNYALPPVSRAYMFSKGAQRGLLGSGTALLDEAAPMGLLSQGAYRGLPLLAGQ